MPPADNNTPAPQQPKQGFFAKLFGKKPKAAQPTVLSGHESQTPPPQLDEAPGLAPSTDSAAPSGDVGQVSTEVAAAPAPDGTVVSSTDSTQPSVANSSSVGEPSVTASVDGSTPPSETPSSDPNQPV